MESAFRDPGLKLIETFGWDGTTYPRLPRQDSFRHEQDRLTAAVRDALARVEAVEQQPRVLVGDAPLAPERNGQAADRPARKASHRAHRA